MNENLVLSNELIKVKLPPWKFKKADVSSVSASSERIEPEFWSVVALYKNVEVLCLWWKYSHMNL